MEQSLSQIDESIRAFMRRSLTAPSSEAEFNDLALALFRAQRASNSAYAKLCAGSKEPNSWREISAAPTVAFKELELTSIPADARTRVFHSSGTTQQKPSRHFHSAESIALYEESLRLWFENNFADRLARRRLIFLTPPGSVAPNSSLVYMFETIAQGRDATFLGSIAPDGSWTCESFTEPAHPVAIFGTAFLFVQLADAIDGIQLPEGSWIFETGGYKGRSRELSKPEFHRLLEQRLGLRRDQIFSEYGMSELSSQAYDQADGRLRFPPWARALIISPETGREAAPGERGLLRIIDLANVYSVAAIQTEDLATASEDTFVLAGRATAAEARGCSLMTA